MTLSVDPQLLAAVAAAAASGLIGSPHCAGMCGGFACAAGSAQGFGLWTAGRLLTYMALGATVGGVGAHLPGPVWVGTVIAAITLVVLCLQLAGLLPALASATVTVRPLGGVAARAAVLLRRPGVGARFGLGLLTGALPCGLVFATLTAPVVAGGALGGALSMLAFGLGTTPALALVAGGSRRIALRSPTHRRLVALGVGVVGVVGLSGRAGLVLP